ncbi:MULTISPECIES: hypothetical protein [Rhodococcus]|uniref:Transposase n=1 Tax=Rhodococcus opacus RKJ300 = JCM 13270 TaxID=1165867 RepID=I0WU89_RHOOP|nr:MULTISPECIES: hypothetical protein [Rhodococcus]EID79955.1 hypothetical protein W59_10619 [Rhodococcus opacus RKJ300 = JCM 13270]
MEAFEDLDAADVLELLGKVPDPAAAARLTRGQIMAALRKARRRDIETKTDRIQTALRAEQLGRAETIAAAYAATTRSAVAALTTLNQEVKALQGQVDAHFGRHPDAEIILSQPGMGPLLGARVLGEFGDDPNGLPPPRHARTTPLPARSPVPPARRRSSWPGSSLGDRLVDALNSQAFSALQASRGARAYYDKQRDRGLDHGPALRQLANRLVGILHGCLKTRTRYDETTAWSHHAEKPAA